MLFPQANSSLERDEVLEDRASKERGRERKKARKREAKDWSFKKRGECPEKRDGESYD